MKSIYTILGSKIYRINQNTAVPELTTFREPGVFTTSNEDSFNKEACLNIFINTLKKPGTKSNKELFNEMIDMMRRKRITEIPFIQNHFKIYVEYKIFEDRKEIDHQALMKPVDPIDKAYILGVSTNNECVYRRVKTFNPKIEFTTKNSVPHGITQTPKQKYTFKVTNIALFEDFANRPEHHGSTYEVGYEIPHCGPEHIIDESLNKMVQIYSTANEGIDIQAMQLNYIPRHIVLNIDFIWANLIVAYNDADVNAIIDEILLEKYPPIDYDTEVPSDDDDPEHLVQDEDDKESADGDYHPNHHGYFDFYERATATNPKSLLVVEDAIPDGSYDVDMMIKKSMVIRDIPDIEVGEYVIYREVLNTV